jgi:predicted dithiol-disulfide oxidoreductase (DUF899 family)
MSTSRHSVRFPGEREQYRAARDELLRAEIDLRNGTIHHFYNTELLFAPCEKGQDPRHVDLPWPLWSLFELTPEGRGTDWYPKLTYGLPA